MIYVLIYHFYLKPRNCFYTAQMQNSVFLKSPKSKHVRWFTVHFLIKVEELKGKLRKVQNKEASGRCSQAEWAVIVPTISLDLCPLASLIFHWLSMLFFAEEAKMMKVVSYKSGRALLSRTVGTNDFLAPTGHFCPQHQAEAVLLWTHFYFRFLLQ